jgi:hypothetical protein
MLEIALGKSRPANISTPIDIPKIKIKQIIPSNFIILSPHPNYSPFIICLGKEILTLICIMLHFYTNNEIVTYCIL